MALSSATQEASFLRHLQLELQGGAEKPNPIPLKVSTPQNEKKPRCSNEVSLKFQLQKILKMTSNKIDDAFFRLISHDLIHSLAALK